MTCDHPTLVLDEQAGLWACTTCDHMEPRIYRYEEPGVRHFYFGPTHSEEQPR